MHPKLSCLPCLLTVGEVTEGDQRHQAEICLLIDISETSMSFRVYLIMRMPCRSLEASKGLMVCFMFKQLYSQGFTPAN
jgi:hypothetical protein